MNFLSRYLYCDTSNQIRSWQADQLAYLSCVLFWLATSRFVHLEKCSLNFSSLSFVIRVNLLHPKISSFLLCLLLPLLFFYLPTFIFCGFLQFDDSFVLRKINEVKYRDVAPLKLILTYSVSFFLIRSKFKKLTTVHTIYSLSIM